MVLLLLLAASSPPIPVQIAWICVFPVSSCILSILYIPLATEYCTAFYLLCLRCAAVWIVLLVLSLL